MTLARMFVRAGEVLTRLAPEAHRAGCRGHVIEIIAARCADAKKTGGALGVLLIGAAELVDVARATLRLRFGRRAVVTQPGPTRQSLSSPGGSVNMFDDVRHALRRLRASPGTALLAAGMLALAIGVSSATFTIADHMLFRPAPFRDPARLVSIWTGTSLKAGRQYLSAPVFQALRASPAFASVSGLVQAPVYIEGRSGLSSVGAFWVTPGLFEMLGVGPLRGRTFTADEGRVGTEDRVILSESVWQGDYGGDEAIIGKSVVLSGASATVVGVMPAAFHFPYESTRIWRPYNVDAPPPSVQGSTIPYARLADGIPEMDATRLASDAVRSVVVTPPIAGAFFRGIGAGFLDDYSKNAIRVMTAGVGLVFLVLCANVTNLLLARTSARRQEFGVCSALGASRARILRQAFIETIVLGVGGLGAGLALASALVSVSRSVLPEAFLLRTLNPVALDWRAVAVTSLLGLFAILAAGLPPAWIGTSTSAADSLRLASRGSSESRAARSWTRLLLVGEIALACSLLVGAAVLVTSFVRLTQLDSGLNLKGITTMWVSLPEPEFKDRPARAAFAEDLRARVRAMPGVRAASLSFGLPPDGGGFRDGQIDVDGGERRIPDATVFDSVVEPEFFEVYGIAMLQGRTFMTDDTPDKVIVGESLAHTLWPGASPIGRTFKFNGAKDWYTVIGVAHEVRSALDDPRTDLPEFYRRLRSAGATEVMLGARCDPSCPSEAAIRDVIRATSPRAVAVNVQPLDRAYLEQFARPRAAAGLAFAFACVSVLAAAGGLFSVLTYAVQRRRREFGIRVALGAAPRQIRGLVLRDGAFVAMTGVAIGAGLTWLLARTLTALAFDVTPASPIVWMVVGGVIAGATLLATWRPGNEAMRADPLALLRDG